MRAACNQKAGSVVNDNEGAAPLNAADSADFRRLYDAVYTALFKVACAITGDADAAEDLAHDAFIKAAERHAVFPSVDDAKFWLIRVVKNAALNYVKRRSREQRALSRALFEGAREAESSEAAFLKQETRRAAREALKRLPPRLREVLVLKEYGGMNYKEIGRALGITEGNVKVRVFRARCALLKLIGEDDVYLP